METELEDVPIDIVGDIDITSHDWATYTPQMLRQRKHPALTVKGKIKMYFETPQLVYSLSGSDK
jgi:hypothetical protein